MSALSASMRVAVAMLWLGSCLCAGAAAAAAGKVAGSIRDSDGKPLAGVRMTLRSKQGAVAPAIAASGKDGAYSFAAAAPGAYSLAADLTGFTAQSPNPVDLSLGYVPVTINFVLRLAAADAPANAPRPQFEASGVRGLIDPGGYSAPANAAAASGLISGVAAIRRAENVETSLPLSAYPCALEPKLKAAAEAVPQKAAALRKLGEFYLVHRRPSEAIQYLVRARQIDDSDFAASSDLAEALMMSGQFDAALDLLTPLAAKQQGAGVHRLLARAEEGTSQFAKASEEYRVAAAREPSEQNFFGVGYELILAGSPADADKAFHDGLAPYPASVTLLIGAGTAEFLLGHGPDAARLLLKASDLAPSDPRPYSFLARIPAVSGAQGEQVLAALKRYAELAPDHADASYFYALGLLHQGDGAAGDAHVEALLERAVELDPSVANAHFQLGSLYARQDDYPRAAHEFEAALRLTPELKEAHYRLAAAYKKMGRTEQAAQELKLFSEAGKSEAESGDSGISIEQFISVVDLPGSHAAAEQCPDALP